ncbi:MAG: histidinol dehydrogenase [Alphaproteobacteria bacterium]|nr:histidinol dehydrogenase [Alphaproteobacteria bacterium]MBT5799840.1 histidinol dehydrogenase [Alphaproteobacteria bacterium]
MSNQTSFSVYRLSTLSSDDYSDLLKRTEDDLSFFLDRVPEIIEAVRLEGDTAIARFGAQFDKANALTAKTIMATKQDFNAAFDKLDTKFIDTLEYAADNIRRFHEYQKPDPNWRVEIRPGVHVGEKTVPISPVALYSPRGKGSFPSVTLMTSIPAIVAGVAEPVILTPPGPDGMVDPATLVAARLAGVELVAKAGGAQAVAAAAFGTESIPKCLKIEGPGSPWFIAAKQLLASKISSRLPAGPSEAMILVDDTIDPALAALDILIECEHGEDSSGFIVTWSEKLAEQIREKIPFYLSQISEERARYATAVLSSRQGGIVIAENKTQAIQFVNDYAPEHLQILSEEAESYVPSIINASEIMLGVYSAGSLANYLLGPNCVLPTSGAAAIHSPLGVMDFMKTISIGKVTESGFKEVAPKTEIFARYEGFDAHANAVSKTRLKILKK